MRFVIPRLAQALLVLFLVVSVTFLLMRLAPGSPFNAGDRKIDPRVMEQLQLKYNLQGSLPEQLGRYWWNLLSQGYLGESTHFKNRSVLEILGETLPRSVALGSLALILALGVGIVAGSLAASHHNQALDRLSMLIALLGICLPGFLLAPLAILLFAIHWPLFPVAGYGSLSHLILPAFCLAAPFAAYCSRLMRSSMLEVLQQDFIRSARAKGLPERVVIYQHALKIGILPLLSYAGPLTAHILTGSLIIEEVFKIPRSRPLFSSTVCSTATTS
ncbi:MAG: ABC transporter permease [Blastochloris sp.]|nr:ABC transporter permease [Blastochloris sp.]